MYPYCFVICWILLVIAIAIFVIGMIGMFFIEC